MCLPQYYLHDADTCLSCAIGCLDCTGPSACTKCDENGSFVLIGGVCECQVGMYLSENECLPCGSMPGCLDCDMDGCISCDSIFGFSLNLTECACDYGHYISPMEVCAQCRIEGCLDCDSAENCVECDNNSYYLTDGGTCDEICGDGILFNLECDDGNTESGDGCSSSCTVENDWTCGGGSSISASACSFSGEISL